MPVNITRNQDFYQLRGPVTPAIDADGYDNEDDQVIYDIRNPAAVRAYVRAEHGRQQIRDAKSGGHQYILLPQKSGFIFIPEGDQDKAVFIALYKTNSKEGNNYKGLQGKQLKIMAQIYMYTYDYQQESYNNLDGVKDIKEQARQNIYRAHNILLGNETLEDIEPDVLEGRIEQWERNHGLGNTRADLEQQVEATIENNMMMNRMPTGFRKVTLSPVPQQIRGYQSLKSHSRTATGTRIKVPKEVWKDISKLVMPDGGNNPDGEKAFAYETMGRGA